MREKHGDYRLKLTVRNDRILRALESLGEKPGGIVAEKIGITYKALIDYISLRSSPIDRHGEIKECAEKICIFTNKMLNELWSPEQMDPLEKNTAEASITGDQLAAISNGLLEGQRGLIHRDDPLSLMCRKEDTGHIQSMIDRLTEREKYIVTSYFGFNGKEKTANEMALEENVSRSRIDQILKKALLKLRHPKLRGEMERDVLEHFDA